MTSYSFPYPAPENAPQSVVIGFGPTAQRVKGPWFSWEAKEGMYTCLACFGKGRGGAGSKTWVSAKNHLNANHARHVANWIEAAYNKGTFERGSIKPSTIEMDPEYRWEWSPTYTNMMNERAQQMHEQQYDGQASNFARAAAAAAATVAPPAAAAAPAQTADPSGADPRQTVSAASQATTEQTIITMQQQIDELKETNDRLESNLQEKIDALQELITALAMRFDASQESHEQSVISMQTKIDALQEANQHVQHKFDTVQQALHNIHLAGSPSRCLPRTPSQSGLFRTDAPGGPGPAPGLALPGGS